MAEQATPMEAPAERPEVAELREELARSRQEVLRLRDLLIGKDAEVGTLRGRLTELEEGSAKLLAAATRVRARLPGSILVLAAGLRKLLRRPRN